MLTFLDLEGGGRNGGMGGYWEESLSALRTGEGGGEGMGEMGGHLEEGRKWKFLYINK